MLEGGLLLQEVVQNVERGYRIAVASGYPDFLLAVVDVYLSVLEKLQLPDV